MGEYIELDDAELDGVAGGFGLDSIATAVGVGDGAMSAVGGAADDAMNSTATALSALMSGAVDQAKAMNSIV